MKTASARHPGYRHPSYHHGDLRAALLEAAEAILRRDGLEALTLRAAAREAGVSHAAPTHHFQDLSGLLTELAAVGFQRFATAMQAAAAAAPDNRLDALGRAYVVFARDNPALFLLMFRSERLDRTRPSLRAAADAAFGTLAQAQGARPGAPTPESSAPAPLSLRQAGPMVGAWALVHGFAMLLIDGRLNNILAALPPGTDVMQLMDAAFDPPGA